MKHVKALSVEEEEEYQRKLKEIRDGKVLVGFESASKKMAWGFIPCSIANVMIVRIP